MPIYYNGSLKGHVSRADLGAYSNKLEAKRIGGGASVYEPMADNPDATVLPRADRFGASTAWNPNNPTHKKLVINNGVGGAMQAVLDLSLVTPELATKAAAHAQSVVPMNVLEANRDIQQAFAEEYMWYLREAGAAKETHADMRQLEATIGTAPGITRFDEPIGPPMADRREFNPPPPALPQPPPPQPVATHRAMPQPPPPIQQFGSMPQPNPDVQLVQPFKQASFAPAQQHSRSLLGAFRNGPEPNPSTRSEPSQVDNGVVQPPMIRVMFDIPGPTPGKNLEYQTDFHEYYVAAGGNAIMFVYDNRYRGGERLIFSQGVEGQFACHVDGTSLVYLIVSPNIEFRIGDKSYYLYIVVESRSYREAHGA